MFQWSKTNSDWDVMVLWSSLSSVPATKWVVGELERIWFQIWFLSQNDECVYQEHKQACQKLGMRSWPSLVTFQTMAVGRTSPVVVWQQRGRLLEKVLKRLPVGCVCSLCTLGAAECEAAVKTWTGFSSHLPVPINKMNTPQNLLKYYYCIEND